MFAALRYRAWTKCGALASFSALVLLLRPLVVRVTALVQEAGLLFVVISAVSASSGHAAVRVLPRSAEKATQAVL